MSTHAADTIGDLFQAAHSVGFIGRRDELELVRGLADGKRNGERLMQFVGPGGFGKTTLLDRVAALYSNTHEIIRWDLSQYPRDRGDTLERFQLLLSQLRDSERPGLWLIDETEEHVSLERVYFRELFQKLPATCVVVLAGRRPLSESAELDPAWQQLLSVHELATLTQQESVELLAQRGLSEGMRVEMASKCGGHPLSLACAALDARKGAPSQASRQPTLPELSAGLLSDVAKPLGLLALMPRLSRSLLCGVVGAKGADAAAETLTRLPFVRCVGDEFAIHPLYREPVLRGVEAIAPAELRSARRLGIRWHADALDRALGYSDRLAIAVAWPMLLRGLESAPEALTGLGGGGLFWDDHRSDDVAALDALVKRWQGDEALDVARYHRDQSPRGLRVVRAADGAVAGALQWVDVDDAAPAGGDRDPCIARLRAGGYSRGVRVLRLLESVAEGQAPGPVTAELVARSAAEALARAGLQHYLIAARDPSAAEPWLQDGYLMRFAELDFQIGSNDYMMVGYAFGERRPSDWMRIAADRIGTTPARMALSGDIPSIVLEALQLYHDDARLMQSRLAAAVAGPRTPTPEDIRLLLATAHARMPDGGSEPTPPALIDAAYFQRRGKQEAIAARLGLTHGTFRRRLRSAVEALAVQVELSWTVQPGS